MNSEIYTKILDTSCQLFGEYGYDKTSMNMIYKEAGVAKGSIYYHFKNKKQLFLETIRHFFEQMNLEEINMDGLTRENFEENLIEMGISQIEMMAKEPSFAGLMKEMIFFFKENLSELDLFNNLLSGYITFFENLIEHGKKLGAVKEDVDSHSASRVLTVFLDAISFYLLLEPQISVHLNLKELYIFTLRSIIFK